MMGSQSEECPTIISSADPLSFDGKFSSSLNPLNSIHQINSSNFFIENPVDISQHHQHHQQIILNSKNEKMFDGKLTTSQCRSKNEIITIVVEFLEFDSLVGNQPIN